MGLTGYKLDTYDGPTDSTRLRLPDVGHSATRCPSLPQLKQSSWGLVQAEAKCPGLILIKDVVDPNLTYIEPSSGVSSPGASAFPRETPPALPTRKR